MPSRSAPARPVPAPGSPALRARRARALALSLAGLAALTWIRVAWLGTLVVDRVGTPWSYGVLGAAWLALAAVAARAYLAAADEGGASLRPLLAGALALQLAVALALPYTSNDLFSNLAYGRMSALGLDPYAAGPATLPAGDPFRALVSPNWIGAPTAYGPLLTALNALAGRAGSVPAAMALFKVVLLATAVATVLAAHAVCRRHLAPERAAPAFVLLAWNPLLAWEIAGQVHNDGVMLLALTAFVGAALAGRHLLAVLLLSIGFWTKFAVAPVLGLYLAYLARGSRARAALGVAIAAVTGALLFLPYWDGPASLAGPLSALRADPGRTTRSFTEIAALLGGLWSPSAAAWAYRLGWGAGVALLAALAVRAVRRARTVEAVLHESLVFLLAYLLVASPFVQPWYLTWLLPLALVEADPRWRRAVALYAALTLVAWGVDVPPLQVLAVNVPVLAYLRRAFRRPAAAPAAEPAIEAHPSVAA
ncbi:MAG TPA: polyprenol phosphomannose-dependent alpha 1,6 mannosyltransferase MptB [Anaeromyxobacteraceae bacterium]|nr:polyprenol phosphomannose-dependent alpha 1,6 mannosyltransferase MptB [Anaeromyxobacteraceae bacterium]